LVLSSQFSVLRKIPVAFTENRELGTENSRLSMTDARTLLRHTLATLAYRAGKAIRNAPASFAGHRDSDSSRTPAQILAHIGDMMDWGLSMARGSETWPP
jgi:hypothetical protein